MSGIIFVLGGARSGKSSFALKQAGKFKKVAFAATCQGLDSEMRQRISRHKSDRPKNWKTFENYADLPGLIRKNGDGFDVMIIDCLTLWVSGLMMKRKSPDYIEKEALKVMAALRAARCKGIIVSNEVGLGIVPKNKLARSFRDTAGRINQLVAERSDEVFFMVSGLEMKVK